MDRGMQAIGWQGRRAWCAAGMLAMGATIMTGCISVTAPDKPIVIELNINIKQEVIYRLAADAGNTIDKNPDIF
jgi:hypothetical protein